MIRVYYLPVITIDNTEAIAGIEFIHDAMLLCTEDPLIRKLIMDTTDPQHAVLLSAAGEVRAPTHQELDLFNARPPIPPPDTDTLEAQRILTMSPASIPMPDTWKLLRIFGRRLGYHF